MHFLIHYFSLLCCSRVFLFDVFFILFFVYVNSLMCSLVFQYGRRDASKSTQSASSASPTIKDAFSVMFADKRILCVGAAQALFEGR